MTGAGAAPALRLARRRPGRRPCGRGPGGAAQCGRRHRAPAAHCRALRHDRAAAAPGVGADALPTASAPWRSHRHAGAACAKAACSACAHRHAPRGMAAPWQGRRAATGVQPPAPQAWRGAGKPAVAPAEPLSCPARREPPHAGPPGRGGARRTNRPQRTRPAPPRHGLGTPCGPHGTAYRRRPPRLRARRRRTPAPSTALMRCGSPHTISSVPARLRAAGRARARRSRRRR